jgi:hypothetical protein
VQLTRHTDDALRTLVFLALRPESRATIEEVAEAFAISRAPPTVAGLPARARTARPQSG